MSCIEVNSVSSRCEACGHEPRQAIGQDDGLTFLPDGLVRDDEPTDAGLEIRGGVAVQQVPQHEVMQYNIISYNII